MFLNNQSKESATTHTHGNPEVTPLPTVELRLLLLPRDVRSKILPLVFVCGFPETKGREAWSSPSPAHSSATDSRVAPTNN